MLILALETSCDETAAAILEFDQEKKTFQVLSNIISSQISLHSPWGGVVPMLAAREHSKNIFPVIEQALTASQKKLKEINLLAVTQGPGLIPALLLGVNALKTLAYFLDLPLLGVQHIEGHICANLINQKNSGCLNCFPFPRLALVVSGGHTQLILEKEPRKYQIIGETLDDAAGEAFDKVAKLLDLGYPGGPIVSYKASQGEKILNKEKFSLKKLLTFPRPMLKSPNLNFSFSGLKTSVLYFYQKIKKDNLSKKELERWKKLICYEFQEAVVEVLTEKTLSAIQRYQPQTFFLAGGVAANQKLREVLQKKLIEKYPQINFSLPQTALCGDNAAMIGVAGLYQYSLLKKESRVNLFKNWKTLSPDANLKLEKC